MTTPKRRSLLSFFFLFVLIFFSDMKASLLRETRLFGSGEKEGGARLSQGMDTWSTPNKREEAGRKDKA